MTNIESVIESWVLIGHLSHVTNMESGSIWHCLTGPDFESSKLLSASWHGEPVTLNTLRQRQHGPHFADDIFECIFVNETCCILIQISLKLVDKGPINNISALV